MFQEEVIEPKCYPFMNKQFQLCSFIKNEKAMAYIEYLPSKERREFTCVHSVTTLAYDEMVELQDRSKDRSRITKQLLSSLNAIGAEDYVKYGISCKARLKGVNSYLEGIATLFNENQNAVEVFDQLVMADQIIGSTHYSLNGEIASFIAHHVPLLKKQYKRFLFQKHRIGTDNAFCNGLIADAEKFYSDEKEKNELILEAGCNALCPTQIDSTKLLRLIPPKCYDKIEEVSIFDKKLIRFPLKINKLTQIQAMDLRENLFTTLPDEIGNLTQLQALWLNDNLLKSLPKEIGNLTQLQTLWLDNNKLSILPKEIGNLTKLEGLDLSGNQFATFPKEICNLTQLHRLFLGNNQFTTLPKEIGKLTQLEKLELQENQLVSLPQEIGNLPNLKELALNDNKLVALPPTLCNKFKENMIKTEIDWKKLCKK